MSFILDALRKSEHERRMETAPDIMHAPAAVTRQALPAWSIVLITALAAALITVSLISWLQRSDNSATAVAVETTTEVPPEMPNSALPTPPVSTPAAAPARPTPAALRAAPTAVPPSEAVRAEVAAVQVPVPAPLQAAPITAEAAVPAAPRINAAELPIYPAIVSAGISVGTLQMQLHVHSGVAANRFVVINGARRREGDTLTAGPIVEEIVPEGAVLSYQGRRFLLTAN
jgi:general secretion pathway protein B